MKYFFYNKKGLALVVGAGGIGTQIAEELSDQLFITSDNPRSEEPQKIVNDI